MRMSNEETLLLGFRRRGGVGKTANGKWKMGNSKWSSRPKIAANCLGLDDCIAMIPMPIWGCWVEFSNRISSWASRIPGSRTEIQGYGVAAVSALL